MAKVLAWSDAINAPTGFGRSAKHVLMALHEAGHEIIHLAVNSDASSATDSPFKVYTPVDRQGDAYGLQMLPEILQQEQGLDLMWSTFDPEVPWNYPVAQGLTAIQAFQQLKAANPGFRMASWFPIDGGPLSDIELAHLGMSDLFEAPVTMSPHVYDLMAWSLRLRGFAPDMEQIRGKLRCIPHGIELDRYTLTTDAERRAAKSRLGMDPEQFVILQVERNQKRKQNYLALEVMERLYKADPKLRDRVLLYQHMNPDEENQGCRMGFNLPELAPRYGLRPGVDVRWPGGFVPEEFMHSTVYKAADVFLSVSTGEGFQYPAWEALATGCPLVVPNNSARKAWFTGVPNVHLYKDSDQSLVLVGGYKRRMGQADTADAARTLRKLIGGNAKYAPKPEAGRAFVEKVADVKDVQRQWVELMAEEEEKLMAFRKGIKLEVPDSPLPDFAVLSNNPPLGLGDLVMAGPGLRALRAKGRVRLHVPKGQLAIARAFDLADEYTTRVPKEGATEAAVGCIDLAQLHRHRDPTARWYQPTDDRTVTLAEHMGIPAEDVAPFSVPLDTTLADGIAGSMRERFGVEVRDCVAVALKSAVPNRDLSTHLPALLERMLSRGLTPLVLAPERLEITRLGVIDMSGLTDDVSAACLLGMCQAAVCADSGPMHWALAYGTPTVGVFTLVEPAARWSHYAALTAAVVPSRNAGDEEFPAGPFTKVTGGEWAATVQVDDIDAALARLLGLEQKEVQLVLPGFESA